MSRQVFGEALNREGGNDPEKYRVERVVDRVNTTGAVFLGLTVGCAECHSYKYDPISQQEFYELFAFFNNADEPTMEVPTREETRKRAAIRAKMAKLQDQLAQHDQSQITAFNDWQRERLAEVNRWMVLKPVTARTSGGSTIEILDDQSLLVGGDQPEQDVSTGEAPNEPGTSHAAWSWRLRRSFAFAEHLTHDPSGIP